MRPTVGQILSGLALGAVAASMLAMPERFIGAENAAVTGLMLQAPSERIVVRAAPIPPRRVRRAAPVKRQVIAVERRASVAVAISRRISVRPRAAAPPPPRPPVRKVVAKRPKPPEAAAPPPEAAAPLPPASPALQVASVSDKKDGEKRKEKKPKKWHDDDDEGKEDRRDRAEDRGDGDKDRHGQGHKNGKHGNDGD